MSRWEQVAHQCVYRPWPSRPSSFKTGLFVEKGPARLLVRPRGRGSRDLKSEAS